MMKTKIRLALAGVLALAVAAGCWTPRVVVSGRCVLATDTKGIPVVEVVREQTVRNDGGFLKAQVAVVNDRQWGQSLQYRFVWKDRNGMELKGAETLWNPLVLRAGEEAVVEGVCPIPGASDFKLDIRPLSHP